MKNHEDVLAIVEELKKLYPEGLCSLQYLSLIHISEPTRH